MHKNKVLLMQPNYAWKSQRTWRYPPYTLCLLKSSLGNHCNVSVFDPNFNNLSEEEVREVLISLQPDVVGVTSISTEYLAITRLLCDIIRKTLPHTTIILGGVIPTVLIEESMQDRNVNYWIRGEGELSLLSLLEHFEKKVPVLEDVNGLCYWKNGKAVINRVRFIQDLDSIPFPDYSEIICGADLQKATLMDYAYIKMKYTTTLLPKNYPFAVTITSRGCPYKCIFCAGSTVSGEKTRYRSSENVLAEIDNLYKQGIKEIIFLDDHFLNDKKRVVKILNTIIERKYDISWKCVNVTVWFLNRELLELMYKSGCTYLAFSIESGNQYVLDNIIKKPVDLVKVPEIIKIAKEIGFNVVTNFVIGFPGETWDQIRDTFRYAEKLKVDLVNFHIATPLPKTELMEICLKENLIPEEYLRDFSAHSGYGKGLITTKEFTPFELEVLRSFEWDRINFADEGRRKAIMQLNGITEDELETWRVNTRRNLGVNRLIENIITPEKVIH